MRGWEKKELLAQIARMSNWVLEPEHISDGPWANQAEKIRNAEVGRRFEAYSEHLSHFVEAQERTADEKCCFVPSKCTIVASVAKKY
jgi:hypothetical protein